MKVIISFIIALIALLLVSAVFGYPVLWVYNWLVTDCFNVRSLVWWEGLCIGFFISTIIYLSTLKMFNK